ncbi:MAG: 2-phospho-L-lactate transferase [Anaerolineaceae bacterium]|nr:2-phospho-L-lactate transferase [Anaerolineaceae bacterium]
MKIVVLVGGVGGAKLALGLARVLPAEDLTVIVNTADDTWMYGLRICPDLDTIMYTLSDLVNKDNGWGIAGDTFEMIAAMRRYGEDAWFGLGDQDMATHILRTRLLHAGKTMTDVTSILTKKLGIHQQILPMTDSAVATIVDTIEYGEIDFQTYFVKHRWQPTVKSLRLEGIEKAVVTPAIEIAIQHAEALIVGPSNPWLSINPILSVPGMRELILSRDIPRVAISPIVGGEAIKGPAAKLMVELGFEASAQAVASYYDTLLNGFVFDSMDGIVEIPQEHVTKFETIMKNDEVKVALARSVLEWIQDW